MDTNTFISRQEHLRQLMVKNAIHHLALNPGPTLTYLTGLHFHLMERPTVLVFSLEEKPLIVLPELESIKLGVIDYPVHAFMYGDDPGNWELVFKEALQTLQLKNQKIGVEPNRWRYLELSYIQSASPTTQFVSAAGVLDELRVIKDDDEIMAMRNSSEIAQSALMATLPSIKVGISEREIASELTAQLLKAGSENELPFSPIVASGPNSANPHATPSERVLTDGDLLVIDWGATFQGYVSDITRTYAIGYLEEKFSRIGETVLRANQAGCEMAKPGISASEVDKAARSIIEQAGYGDLFTHRTGHGIGLDAHEAPYIHAGNSEILQPGMTFTVEPGIYLAGCGGCRIEDNVVITKNGSTILTTLSRKILVLD